ncbi:MAG: flagellin [Armatimonadota bacterium]
MRTSLQQRLQTAMIYMEHSSKNLYDSQAKTVSGKRILKPSDDVPGTSRAMQLRSTLNTMKQYMNNIDVSMPALKATEAALGQVTDALQVVNQIAIAAANDITDDRQAYVAQLNDILDNLMDVANTKHAEQFIFSGTATNEFTITKGPLPTDPYVCNPNVNVKKAQVLSWVSLPTNVPGQSVFNFDGSAGAGTTNVFQMIIDLRDSIAAADTPAISAHLDNIQANLNNALSIRARVGSWMQRMERAKDTLLDSDTRVRTMLSDVEDIDLPEAIVQLKTHELVYQTALSVTQRVLDVSLAGMSR